MVKNWKNWLPWMVAVIAVVACVFVVCRDKEESSGSKSSYTGRYELKQIVGKEDTYNKKDFEEWGITEPQHVTLNKDGTGRLALALQASYGGVETVKFYYTYDAAEKSGYLYIDEEDAEIKFTIKNGKLKFDQLGVQWIFEK